MADSTIYIETSLTNGETSDIASADQHLIAELQAGVEHAYEVLLNRFSNPVYNLVYRLLADSTEANDVVQDVFLKIFRNIGKFRGDCNLKTWVYRIAVNEAYNHRRWFSRHRKQEVGLDVEDESAPSYAEQLADPRDTPFDFTFGMEQKQRIEEALCQLKPIFKAAVVLRDIEGLSYEEISEIMQVSLGTVKSRILRGREGLKKILLAGQAMTGNTSGYPARMVSN